MRVMSARSLDSPRTYRQAALWDPMPRRQRLQPRGRVCKVHVLFRNHCSMRPEFAPSPAKRRAIRLWLFAVAGLVFLMVVVGGATRLTESGLSIVEWKPVTGVVPPHTQAQWRREFEKYKAIPQYRLMNLTMSLDEFKTIYWWEWGHRLLGRFIGVAFLLPLLWFWWQGWIARPLGVRLLMIFGLGALQGVVGWWMVASGLVERVEVSQYRLATHLLLACLIFVAALWTALGLEMRPTIAVPARTRTAAAALVILALLQIYIGALLAGLRGGLVYNTWPSIDGAFIPPVTELFSINPGWHNLFENVLTVQFEHRMTAYALWAGAMWHAVSVGRLAGSRVAISAIVLATGVTVQGCLGILTLVQQVPLPLALLHQAMAIVVLSLAVVNAQRLSGTRTPAIVGTVHPFASSRQA
jgi:heme a synthase